MKHVKFILHLLIMIVGVTCFFLGMGNKRRWHGSFVSVHCYTQGWISEIFSKLIEQFSSTINFSSNPCSGVLGDITFDNRQSMGKELREKGFLVFERALSDDVCSNLIKFATETTAIIRPMDGELKTGSLRRVRFNAQQEPSAIRYDYDPNDVLRNYEVHKLLADESLLMVAQDYLGVKPRFDVISMWWHTNLHAQPDSEAAQLYHFDLDRFKWLKIFIYLTDVGIDDGPHSFIKGSHVLGGVPKAMMEKGYARLSDDEVMNHYGAQNEIKFTAPRGTIIIEDTRGLHKGNPVIRNSRLILQLQLSNCLFGGVYPKNYLPAQRHPALQKRIDSMPDVYQAYL